uniref:Uncharacterized protein n=1 Tax=Avena sativa TaxID=4498 RepID=A0ACD5X635_AVESA
MAEKISTLILKVDLDCCSCYKKIRKILCKLQDGEGIRTISYDDGSNTIAVVGPFDPHRLSCKIRCKGGKVIKGIEIIQHGGGGGGGEPPSNMEGPPPMKSGKKKSKGKTKHKEMEPHPPPGHEQPPQPPQPPPPVENPPPPAQPAAPDSHISTVMPPTMEEKKHWEMAAELEPTYEPFPPPPPVEHERPTDQRLQPSPPTRPVLPVDVKPTMAEIEIPSWPAPPQPIGTAGSSYGCSCCQPCYRGYYEGCRCCSCGRVYGYAVGVLPTPAGCYAGGGSYRPGCQLYTEEDPASACAVM